LFKNTDVLLPHSVRFPLERKEKMMSKELWLQGYHDALEGRPRRKFLGEHMESKYPPYDEGYEEGLKGVCSKCGENDAQPDTDPPMCTDCMAQKGGGNDPETKEE